MTDTSTHAEEIVDIEAFAKREERVPEGKSYRVRIDKEVYVVHTAHPTGTELLALAGKTPTTHRLYQIIRGQQPKLIRPEQKVDLTEPGVERFTTQPIDPTEG